MHARLSFRSVDCPQLTDLASGNGTFVNGVRLAPQAPYNIETGDAIQFSAHERSTFVFELPRDDRSPPPLSNARAQAAEPAAIDVSRAPAGLSKPPTRPCGQAANAVHLEAQATNKATAAPASASHGEASSQRAAAATREGDSSERRSSKAGLEVAERQQFAPAIPTAPVPSCSWPIPMHCAMPTAYPQQIIQQMPPQMPQQIVSQIQPQMQPQVPSPVLPQMLPQPVRSQVGYPDHVWHSPHIQDPPRVGQPRRQCRRSPFAETDEEISGAFATMLLREQGARDSISRPASHSEDEISRRMQRVEDNLFRLMDAPLSP